jgi:hypothetical protein
MKMKSNKKANTSEKHPPREKVHVEDGEVA